MASLDPLQTCHRRRPNTRPYMVLIQYPLVWSQYPLKPLFRRRHAGIERISGYYCISLPPYPHPLRTQCSRARERRNTNEYRSYWYTRALLPYHMGPYPLNTTRPHMALNGTSTMRAIPMLRTLDLFTTSDERLRDGCAG